MPNLIKSRESEPFVGGFTVFGGSFRGTVVPDSIFRDSGGDLIVQVECHEDSRPLRGRSMFLSVGCRLEDVRVGGPEGQPVTWEV